MQKILNIFDASGALTGSITSYADEQISKTLNNDITFTFSVPFTDSNKTLCVVGNKVQIDSDIFIISQIEDIKSQSEYYRKCTCDGLHYELLANLIKGSHSYTGIVALFTAAVAGSGWGVVLEGSYTVPNDLDMSAESTLVHVWDYENSLKIINDLCDKWNVEVAYTADIVFGNQITNKKIHIYSKRGVTRTGQYTFSKNIESLKKTTDFTGIETRIIGVGAVLSSDGTNNTYRDFSDAVWTTAAGKPANKPAGQNWIQDDAAVALYGVRTGTYKLNTIDAAKLLTNSWRSLQARKNPVIGYQIAVGDLYSLIGDTAYTCDIGDTIPVYDADLGINISARIMELEYNPNDATETKVVFGNYRKLVDVDTIQDIQEDADATQSYVVGEIGKTNASITVQAGQIALKANQTTVDALGTRVSAAEIALQPDNIRLTVGQIGSNNFIYNGRTLAGINFWGTTRATRAVVASEQLSRNVFRVVCTSGDSGYMTQTVTGLVVGSKYTVSARCSKDAGAGEARIVIYMNSVWSTPAVKTTNGWEIIKATFTATATSIDLYFGNTSLGAGSGWVDIKLEEGENATAWAPAAAETEDRLLSAEASISVQAGQILLKAEKTYVDTQLAGKASTTVTTSLQSQIDAQAGQIALKASKTVTDGLTERMDAAELLLEPEQIRLSVGQIGGNNLILNGKCDFGTSEWWTSRATLSLSSSGVLGRSVFRVVATESANAGYMSQTISGLIVGNKYTVSARASKDSDATSARIMINNNGVYSVLVYKDTNGWEIIKGTFTANATSVNIYLGNMTIGTGSGWTDIKLEEGVNATIWTPNASELKSSSMSITNDTVAIDTQNFNLTLRDSSNNPSLIIDANSKAFNTQNTVGTMSLSGNSLKGLLPDGFWVTSQSNWGWYLRNRFTKETADALKIEGYDNGSNDYGVLFTMGTPFDFMDFGTGESILRLRRNVKTFAGGWTEGKATFNSDVYFTGFQLKELDWTNKIQSGATTSNATANTTSTVTFPTAFPAGSVVRVSLTARGNATAYLAAAATNTSFTYRCTSPSTICEWIAVAQQD